MKKINFIAIATVALTSVFGFTSCDKNNDSFNQPVQAPKPIPTVQQTPAVQQPVDQQSTEEETVKAKEIAYNVGQTNVNFVGTWSYVAEDGKTFVLNVTEELEKGENFRNFAATLTVDGVEYEGEMNSAAFKTKEKSTDNKSRLYGVSFSKESTDTELITTIVYDRQKVDQGVVFKKVDQNVVTRGAGIIPGKFRKKFHSVR